MRKPITAGRVREFMKALGGGAKHSARIYLVGGSSAVLLGWRQSTVDIDLKSIPEDENLVRQLSALKESLEINIELASPDQFIPELPGWEERSRFIRQEGKLTFLHYDFYAQALAKIERSHETDTRDVQEMISGNLVEPDRLLEFFLRIEADIPKYPALDGASFREKVELTVRKASNSTRT